MEKFNVVYFDVGELELFSVAKNLQLGHSQSLTMAFTSFHF